MQTSRQTDPEPCDAARPEACGATRRYASSTIAQRYPLPTEGPLQWSSSGTRHRVELPIGELLPGQILVPSFSRIGADPYAFQFSLSHGPHRWVLAPIGGDLRIDGAPGPQISTHIDYFQVERGVNDLVLELVVESPRPPVQHLMTIATRPARLEPTPGLCTSRRLAVSPLSQMTAPRSIRHGICSPTSLTMVLRHHGVATDLARMSRACYHAASRMFGVWPAAIHAASRVGAPGAVELFTSTDLAAALLEQNMPLVASIRFGPGELRGSPQLGTGGHLVVITGLSETEVHVNDPGADDPRAVCTSYARDEFARAWLTHRGAGYVILSP